MTTADSQSGPGGAGFPVTRWSVVDAAVETDAEVSADALERFCGAYWYPLYAFARRSGQSAEDAKDLTQGFFAALLDKGWLGAADRDQGKLRTFLLTAFRRFMAKEWRRGQAVARGGTVAHVPWDEVGAESRYAAARAEMPPEKIFDRQWALALMERAVAALRGEFVQAGREAQFEILKETLMAGRGGVDYGRLAEPLEMNEGAVRVAVHRLRKRFRKLFREEVERTLVEGEDLEEEMRWLAGALIAC